MLRLQLCFVSLFVFCFNIFSQIPTTNLKLWFRADSGIVESAGKISEWQDFSGNNFNATQPNAAWQPSIIYNELCGKPIIRFDKNNYNRFKIDSILNFNRFSVFILYKVNNGGDYGGPLYFASLSNKSFMLAGQSNSFYQPNVVLLDNGDEQGYSRKTTKFYGTSMSSYEIHNFSGINEISNFQLDYRINGQADTLLSGNYAYYTPLGQYIGWSTDYLSVDIAEIIIYDSLLTNVDIVVVENYLHNKYSTPLELGADIQKTNNCDTVLKIGSCFTSIIWKDGSAFDSLVVSKTGLYWVSVKDALGYVSTDTINVQFPTINPIVNDTICQGNSIPWNTNLNTTDFNFEWNDTSTDSLLIISQPGDYWVKVTDTLGCFQYSDTITIAVDSFPTQTTLGLDKTLCQGATIGLETGIGATNYLWNTNDTTAQITIDTTGNYWVHAENSLGCVANDTIQITVNGTAPTVSFNIQDNCVNKTVAFNNTSFTTDGSNIIDWNWDFGNGETSTIQNPQLNYASAGLYNVTLQIQTDSGCSNTLTQQIRVHEKPAAGFFPSATLMCSSQNSFFTENSFSSDGIINSWCWDFGTTSATDTSSIQNGYYSYSTLGNYTVKLIVSTEFGCLDTVSHLINIKQSPTAIFIFQDSCLTNQTKFINSSTGSISITNWDFGDGNSSTLINPFHVYSSPGSYDVVLAIKATNSCWDTLIKPLHIYDNPTANFVTDKYCVGSNYQLFDSSSTSSGILTQWNWNISSLNFQSTNQNPMIYFNQADSGTFQIKLYVINGFGCKDSITKTMSVYPLPCPNFDFSPEIGLPPLLVNFNNQTYGGNSYNWNFGDGNSSIDFSPIYTFQDSGIFNITLTSTSLHGCIDSISKTIQLIEPVIDLAVKNIYYEFLPNSNFMKMSVQLANVGRVTIKNINLLLQNSSTGTILESWNGSLAPNMQNIYTFTSLIEMPNGEIPSLICVKASNINHGVDANLLNNEFCKTLNKFELINLYPNPTSKQLYLEFISPEVSTLEINLFDNAGNIVSTLFSGQSSKGINRINFLMSIYSQGLYVLEIKNKEEIIRKKIVVN